MHPKTMRQHNGGQQATATRRHSGPQRAQTRVSVTTEYQERFLPPRCHTTLVTTSTKKDPYHPLKGTSTDVTTFRSYCVTHKWMKNPPKAPQPSLPPKANQRCSSAPHSSTCFIVNQLASKVEDYTSVYKNDFRAWAATKRQPYKLSDSLKVNQGLVVTKSASREGRCQKTSVQVDANSKPDPQGQEPQPFESITSYRSHYIPHPLQPRRHSLKPANQSNKDLLSEPGPKEASGPKLACDINQQMFDGASDFLKQFKTWSLETKFHGEGKAKVSSPAAEDNVFLSTTHADYTPHECPRTKPILPSMQGGEKSKEPFQGTTTMKEDYKAWDTPRRLPIVRKGELEWPKKIPFSVCAPKHAGSCKTNPKPFCLPPKPNESAGCSSSCNAAESPQCAAENGAFSSFGCLSTGNDQSSMYWSTSVDRGVTWADGDICDDPSHPHQIISCMVSSRS